MQQPAPALHRFQQLLASPPTEVQTGIGVDRLRPTDKPFLAAVDAVRKMKPVASDAGVHRLVIAPRAFFRYLSLVPIAQALQRNEKVTVLLPDIPAAQVLQNLLGTAFTKDEITVVTDAPEIRQKLAAGHFDRLQFSGASFDWAPYAPLLPASCTYRKTGFEKSLAVIDETANLEAVSSRLVWAKTDQLPPYPEPEHLFVQEGIKKHLFQRLQEKLHQFQWPQTDPGQLFDLRGFRSLNEVLQGRAELEHPALGLFIFSRYKPHVMRLITECPAIGVCLNEEVLDFENRAIPYSSKKRYRIAAFFEEELMKPFESA